MLRHESLLLEEAKVFDRHYSLQLYKKIMLDLRKLIHVKKFLFS